LLPAISGGHITLKGKLSPTATSFFNSCSQAMQFPWRSKTDGKKLVLTAR
jgi:hypothetical protein